MKLRGVVRCLPPRWNVLTRIVADFARGDGLGRVLDSAGRADCEVERGRHFAGEREEEVPQRSIHADITWHVIPTDRDAGYINSEEWLLKLSAG